MIKRKSWLIYLKLRYAIWKDPDKALLENLYDFEELYDQVCDKTNQFHMYYLILPKQTFQKLHYAACRNREREHNWNSLHNGFYYAVMAGAEVEAFLDTVMHALYTGDLCK